MATYWAGVVTDTGPYYDSNGVLIAAMEPLEMYDLMVDCCVDPCASIIASLDATISTQPANPPGTATGTAEVIFVDFANILPPNSNVAYNWYTGTIANGWLATGTQNAQHLNELYDWGTFGNYHIEGLAAGDYHVSVDTGDGCWRWFDFTIE